MMFHTTEETPFRQLSTASRESITPTFPVTSIQQFRGIVHKALTQLESSLPSDGREASKVELEMLREDLELSTDRIAGLQDEVEESKQKYREFRSKCSKLEEENRKLRESGEMLKQMREFLDSRSKHAEL
jgi:chromosome segregation ATPase